MKKKLIRGLRICFVLLFIAAAVLSGLIYYAYQHTFKIPAALTNRIRDYTVSFHQIDFSFSHASFNVSRHTLNVLDLKIMLPNKSPFLACEKADIFLASGTGILDYYYARAVIERIELNKVTVDSTVERPERAKEALNPFAEFPASELYVQDLSLQTKQMLFTFPGFNAVMLKGEHEADLKVSIARGPFGGGANLRGIVALNGNDSRFLFNWKHENLAMFTPLALIQHLYGLSLVDGSLEIDLDWNGDFESRLARPAENLFRLFSEELKGSIKLAVNDFSWTDFNGSLLLQAIKTDDSPWQLELKQKSKSSSVSLDAIWQGSENSLTDFKADFQATNLRLSSKFFDFFALQLLNMEPGQIDFSGTLTGNSERFQGAGHAVAKNWQYQNKKIDMASLSWELTDDNSLKAAGELNSVMGNLSGEADLKVHGSQKGLGSVKGNLFAVDLKSLRPFIDSPVAGSCSGPFLVNFDLNHPASTSYELDLEMREGEFYSFSPEIVRARIFGTALAWNIADPVATFADESEISVDGVISEKKIRAKVKINAVDLTVFGLSPHIVAGRASLEARAAGTIESPELSGDLWGKNLEIYGQGFKSFKSQLSLDKNSLDLSPMVLLPASDGMIDGFYSFNLASGQTRSMKFNLQNLDLVLIDGFLPEAYSNADLEGRIAGSIAFDGQKANDYWDIFIDGRRLSIFNQEVDSIFFEGSIFGSQGEVRNLFVRAFGGKLNLSGQILGPDKFDGSIEAESILLDRIKVLTDAIPGIRGELNFQGNVEWEGPKKSGYFTLFGDKIRVRNRDLGNFGAEVVINNKGMKVLKAEFDKLGVKFNGDVDWKGRKPYQADLQLNEVDLSFLTRAHGFKEIEYGGLIVGGQCTVAGDLASLTPDVIEMQLDTIKIQKDNDVIVANQPMQLKYQNNNLEIRSLELKYRQGVIGLEGIFKPGEETALMLNGKDFSLRALGRLLDMPDWNYDGSLSVNASLFGTYPDLKVRAEARVDQLEVVDRKIPGITAKLSGDTRQINLETFKVQLPNSSFDLQGLVNIKDMQAIDHIKLHLNIPKGPLSDLPGLMPGIFRQASGSLEGSLDLLGNPTHPNIAGEVKLTADNLGLVGMRKPFTDISFAASTKDQIISIDDLQARLGHGKIYGDGSINFRDGPGSITARISGQNIDFAFLNFEINKASASFNIAGNLYNPVILGDVFVPRGKLLINSDLLKDRPGFDSFLDSLKFKINFVVPSNFWLRSSFLNAEMKGRFSVMGDLNNVNLDGGISCIQGWLYFQRRKFRIDTGEIKFGGVENTFDPHIYLKSEGRIQNTQVYLTLQGQLSSFTPRIHSSPPMSEGDLLALLTLGRDMNTAMQSDSKELFENEILEGLKNSYISALISNTLSSALNLDELFLTSLYDRTDGKPRSYIRVGKYVANNLFMAYEGTLDETQEETFIFEYRLPKGFVVNLEFEQPEKDKRLGLRYDWKFW
jgi:hypothetical protein